MIVLSLEEFWATTTLGYQIRTFPSMYISKAEFCSHFKKEFIVDISVLENGSKSRKIWIGIAISMFSIQCSLQYSRNIISFVQCIGVHVYVHTKRIQFYLVYSKSVVSNARAYILPTIMFDTAMQRVYTLISSIKPKLRLDCMKSACIVLYQP